MRRTEQRLRSLGLTLPPAKAPVANYLGTKRSGDLLFVGAARPGAPTLVVSPRLSRR